MQQHDFIYLIRSLFLWGQKSDLIGWHFLEIKLPGVLRAILPASYINRSYWAIGLAAVFKRSDCLGSFAWFNQQDQWLQYIQPVHLCCCRSVLAWELFPQPESWAEGEIVGHTQAAWNLATLTYNVRQGLSAELPSLWPLLTHQPQICNTENSKIRKLLLIFLFYSTYTYFLIAHDWSPSLFTFGVMSNSPSTIRYIMKQMVPYTAEGRFKSTQENIRSSYGNT